MIDRKEIENIKELLKQKLNSNSGAFLQSIIRDLDRRKADIKDVLNDDKNINDIIKNLGIPATQKSLIKAELEKAQSKIAKVYDDYFSELPGKITDADYEKMLAVHEVDFSQINKAERKIIEQEIKRAARAGYGYDTLRSRLKDRNICDANAKTLANTALAQFDNAYMFENAKQAGIEYYKYDGPLNTNTRTFCRGHLGNVYTIDEIKLMDNGQGLSVLTSLGGYNCSHYWSPVLNPDTTKNKKVDESKTASNGLFNDFYEKGKEFSIKYDKIKYDNMLKSDKFKSEGYYNEKTNGYVVISKNRLKDNYELEYKIAKGYADEGKKVIMLDEKNIKKKNPDLKVDGKFVEIKELKNLVNVTGGTQGALREAKDQAGAIVLVISKDYDKGLVAKGIEAAVRNDIKEKIQNLSVVFKNGYKKSYTREDIINGIEL